MARLLIPTPYRYYTEGEKELEVEGRSVAQAIDELLARYPQLKPHLVNSHGRLHPFINLFVNDRHIRELQGLDTPLQAGDRLRIVPSIAGGGNTDLEGLPCHKKAAIPRKKLLTNAPNFAINSPI